MDAADPALAPDAQHYRVEALPLAFSWGQAAMEHAYAIWRLLSPQQRQDYEGFRVRFTDQDTQLTLLPREPAGKEARDANTAASSR